MRKCDNNTAAKSFFFLLRANVGNDWGENRRSVVEIRPCARSATEPTDLHSSLSFRLCSFPVAQAPPTIPPILPPSTDSSYGWWGGSQFPPADQWHSVGSSVPVQVEWKERGLAPPPSASLVSAHAANLASIVLFSPPRALPLYISNNTVSLFV